MKNYVTINPDTNFIQSIFSWRDEQIGAKYTPDKNTFEVDDVIFKKIQEKILNSTLKVLNLQASNYEEMIEEKISSNVEEEIQMIKNYLTSTDFYYIRQLDVGEPIPPDVKVQRDEYRQRMKELGL